MKTPRLKVTITTDAPCGKRLTAADRKDIAASVSNIVYKAMLNEITIDVGEDLEALEFVSPRVTVTQTPPAKRRAKR